MKITLENTAEIVETRPMKGDPSHVIPCRVWKGTTDAGVPIRAVIALIFVERTEDQSAFERELEEKHPRGDEPRVLPVRLVL